MSAFSRVSFQLALFIAAAAFLLGSVGHGNAQSDQPLVQVATINGPITPVVARYIDRAIKQAESNNAALLVIELDTPGGTVDAMDDIVDDILTSTVPVAVYVSPANARAASAGVYITYAAHVAAMAPTTNIGSASPVMIGTTGSIRSDETMQLKVMNDALARITNLAELRDRNVDWAQSAVRDAANITAEEALDLGVIDLIAPDLESLLASIDGKSVTLGKGTVTLSTANPRIERIDMSFIEEAVQYLANPTVAYLLVTFGLIALFVELANPGVGIPGILGTIALVLGLVGLGSLPVVWVGLGLMVLAFVLFVADIFVPSLGLLTIGGLVSFLVGSNILIADGTPEELRISRPVIWTVTACIAATTLVLGTIIVRSQLRPLRTGRAGMIGQLGVARTDLNPSGQVLVFGEIWTAESPDEPISAGGAIVVERVRKLKLYVRAARESDSEVTQEIGDRRTVIPVQ